MMQVYGAFNFPVADEVLTRLDEIDGSAMVNAVKQLPPGWLDTKVGAAFTKWFGSRSRRDRIAAIRKGLSDASYL
jgi:hypothetical protein